MVDKVLCEQVRDVCYQRERSGFDIRTRESSRMVQIKLSIDLYVVSYLKCYYQRVRLYRCLVRKGSG
jgi:hypothetical protein